MESVDTDAELVNVSLPLRLLHTHPHITSALELCDDGTLT